MSLYEGLSLVLSTVGTMFTVYLGFRQLRQAAPAAPLGVAAAAPTAGSLGVPPGPASYTAPPTHRPWPEHRPVWAPVAGAGSTAYGVARVPAPPYGRAPTPTPSSPAAPASPAPASLAPASPAAPASPPTPAWYPPSAAPPIFGAQPAYGAPLRPARVRPRSVRAASILLFVAAALQPVVLFAYYGIEYAINAEAASTDFSNAGAADVMIFGVVAVLCGILGIFVARGSRVAAWFVWVFGLLGVPLATLAALGVLLSVIAPSEDQDPAGLLVLVAAYLVVVSLAIATSAILLINSKARAFFFTRA